MSVTVMIVISILSPNCNTAKEAMALEMQSITNDTLRSLELSFSVSASSALTCEAMEKELTKKRLSADYWLHELPMRQQLP